MVVMLCHSDEVSGTTILNDGTKVFWTEGHSDTVIKHPNGRVERLPASRQDHPLLSLPEITGESDVDERRPMSEDEEQEWEDEMHSGGEWG